MSVEIGSGIQIGPGILIGPGAVSVPLLFIDTEDSNQLTTESNDNLITES